MEYPDLPPEQANFCAMCREPLFEHEITEYRNVNMPPLCGFHLADLLPKRDKCLHLFQKLNLS
jgi:hypothetical protein